MAVAVSRRGKAVGPWPVEARTAPREPGCTGPGVEHAFPSGRAAIRACLKLAGVGQESVVATPECVTGCLAEAVRRLARTVPLRTVDLCTRPHAVIVYEQWGWPLAAQAEDALVKRFAGVPLVLDRVDSADFFAVPRTFGAFEVLSLSKVLGLAAGGILRRRPDGALLDYAARPVAPLATSCVPSRLLVHPAVLELFKQSDCVHPDALDWLAENCALTLVEAERRARSAAARLLLASPLSAGWPAWMARAIEDGAGPVWAPILRGSHGDVHRRMIACLEGSLGIRAAVRTFNWSGNPLSPCFEPSLALPIHGGLGDAAEPISLLSALAGVR